MILKELIDFLESKDPTIILPLGFNNPDSYRGYYEELAFEPAENISIGEMLKCAIEALGSTYTGYKGGEYTMGEYTDVYLANWGETGESIGPVLLNLMVKSGDKP